MRGRMDILMLQRDTIRCAVMLDDEKERRRVTKEDDLGQGTEG